MNIREFLRWWRDGLVALVPPDLRGRIAPRAPVLEVQAEGADCHFRLRAADGTVQDALTERFFPAHDHASENLAGWLADRVRRVSRREVVVDAEQTLKTEISLPAAAAENLAEVVGFEMDRYTPFKADQVYFGHRVTRVAGDTLHVRLALVPRQALDGLLTALARVGVDVDGIRSRAPDAPLMTAGLGATSRGGGVPLTSRLLAGTAVVLACLALYLPFHLKGRALEKVEARLGELKSEALALRKMENSLNEALRGSQAVAERKRSEALTLDVLLEVTRVLPADAWAYVFQRQSDSMTIQGEAAAATALLSQLETSQMFENATFRSTVQRNNATGLDRYQIVADVVKPGGNDG